MYKSANLTDHDESQDMPYDTTEIGNKSDYIETLNMCAVCMKSVPECGLPGVVFACNIPGGNPKGPDSDKVVGCKGLDRVPF